jgi:hypothetical protein
MKRTIVAAAVVAAFAGLGTAYAADTTSNEQASQAPAQSAARAPGYAVAQSDRADRSGYVEPSQRNANTPRSAHVNEYNFSVGRTPKGAYDVTMPGHALDAGN